jgi:hypothetical protein
MQLIKESDFSQALENLLEAEKLFKKNLLLYDYVVHKLAKLYENTMWITEVLIYARIFCQISFY